MTIRAILHNSQDAASRALVAAGLAADPTLQVIDWYDESREAWAVTDRVSAFPTTVHDVPALALPGGEAIAASVHLERCPLDWTAVQTREAAIARLVALCGQPTRTAEEDAEALSLREGLRLEAAP